MNQPFSLVNCSEGLVLGQGVGSPLGSLTDFASCTEVGCAENALVEAAADYCRRLHARRVAGLALEYSSCKRVKDCGYRLTNRSQGVGVWQMPDRQRGRVSGVCLCGSSWVCPICAPRIAAQRVGEVTELAAAAVARGYVLRLESATIPHRSRDSAESTIRRIQKAKRSLVSGRKGQILSEGRVGYVDGGELTWSGENGAHPHIHRLVIERPGEYDAAAQGDAWLNALEQMGRRTRGTDKHAWNSKILDKTESARYISKIGLETASGALAIKDSLTPLGMVFRVVDGTLARHPWLGRFRECAEALKATKFPALRFSRGLRKEFGLTEEAPDEKLAAEESTETDQLLGYLSEPQWLKIRENRLEGYLVYVAQQGKEAVENWLRARDLGYLHDGRDELLYDIVRHEGLGGDDLTEGVDEQASRDVSAILIQKPVTQLKFQY